MDSFDHLHPRIREAVEDLIRDNVESCRSFEEAAKASGGSPMSALFREIATTRSWNAADLRRFLLSAGGEPLTRDHPRSELHQWWQALAASAPRGSARAMLSAAERSEQAMEVAYERLVEKTEGFPIGDLIRGQRHEVHRHHDEIRDLRERSAAAMI